jgi:hypothetical protein
MEITYEDIVAKFQALYPTQFAHVIAETQNEKLQQELAARDEEIAALKNGSGDADTSKKAAATAAKEG